MFRDEAERQRAREAAYAFHKERCRAIHVEVYDDTFDRLYPPVVEPAAPKCKHGYNPNACELGFPGCARADEGLVEEDARRRDIPDATPSPAFAAAVAKFEDAVRGAMMSGDTWDIERADRARAALVRCHLEEVERGK